MSMRKKSSATCSVVEQNTHDQAKKPARGRPDDHLRKQAVWLFPGVFLIHSLFIYGAYRPFVRASLIAALASTAVGFASRWIRNLRAIQALAMFLLAFLMLYTMGIVVPISFLVVVQRRELIGSVTGSSSAAIIALVAWRTHASLRREWSLPLEQSPGVVLYPHDNTVVRVAVDSSSRFLPVTAIVMMVTLISLLVVARGNSWHLLLRWLSHRCSWLCSAPT